MRRAVFDTVIFVRALINPASICGRLIFQYADRYRLFLSEPVVREILEVLHRPELTRKFRRLEAVHMSLVLRCVSQAEVVDVPVIPAISRGRNDDMFLATARAAGAAYLVSEDRDLLVLDPYAETRIVTAADFLAVLKGQASGAPDA